MRRVMSRMRLVVGLALVLAGIGLLLDVWGVLDFHDAVHTYWPVLLIALGAMAVASRPHRPVAGLVLMAVGAMLLLDRLGKLPPNWGRLVWPLILVVLGLAVLMRASGGRGGWGGKGAWGGRGGQDGQGSWRYRDEGTGGSDGAARMDRSGPGGRARARAQPRDADTTAVNLMFSGANELVTSQAYRGGKVEVAFGGCRLDLRQARLAPEGGHLAVDAMFGGVDIFVPPTWRVHMQGRPFAGGIRNDAAQGGPEAPVLQVDASAMFGGVHVRY